MEGGAVDYNMNNESYSVAYGLGNVLIMNGFKLLLLIIQAFEVFSSSKLFEFKFPHPCGQTAIIPEIQTKGKGNIIPPHKYSWLASLEYGNLNTFGHCAGSVINSRYVLTAAQCVTGERIQKLGGL